MITQAQIDLDAVSLVTSTKKHFKMLREKMKYESEWKNFESSYFNGTADFYDGVAKIRIPILHTCVERIVPKMDKVIFPPDGEFLATIADDPENDVLVDQAERAAAVIKDQFRNVKVRTKLIGAYRSLCIYGTVFLKHYWFRKTKKRYSRVKGERVPYEEIQFDDPDFYSPRIWDIYIDPRDENLEGALIEEQVVDYQEIYNERIRKDEDGEETGIYENVEEAKKLLHKRESDTDKRASDNITGLNEHEYGPHEKKVKLLEYWGPVPKYFFTKKEEDKENFLMCEDACIVVAVSDGDEPAGVLLRCIENPFDHQSKPYLRGRYIKVDGRAYGLGVMSVNIPMEQELNTLRCQLMDLRTFLLKKKWLKDRSADISDAALKDLANQVIETNDVNGLVDIKMQDFSPTAGVQEAGIKNDLEESTGASKLLGGTPAHSNLERTASGIATVVSGGLERFELVVTQFEEEVLVPLAQAFWQLDQQFLPEGRDVYITGKQLIRVLPEEINFPRIKFLGIRESGEKEFKINALNILIQNLAPYVQFGLDPIPVLLRFIKFLGLGDLIPEIDKRPESQLEYTPEGELILLRQGRKVKVDFNDPHDDYIAAYESLLQEKGIPDNVRANTVEALGQRHLAKQAIQIMQERMTTEGENNAA
jgi:hypothetical protein